MAIGAALARRGDDGKDELTGSHEQIDPGRCGPDVEAPLQPQHAHRLAERDRQHGRIERQRQYDA